MSSDGMSKRDWRVSNSRFFGRTPSPRPLPQGEGRRSACSFVRARTGRKERKTAGCIVGTYRTRRVIQPASRDLSPVAKPLTAIIVEAYESGDYAADVCSGPRKEV